MSISLNGGSNPNSVTFNGSEVMVVEYDGRTVWVPPNCLYAPAGVLVSHVSGNTYHVKMYNAVNLTGRAGSYYTYMSIGLAGDEIDVSGLVELIPSDLGTFSYTVVRTDGTTYPEIAAASNLHISWSGTTLIVSITKTYDSKIDHIEFGPLTTSYYDKNYQG